ncbi:MAG: colicin production protein [Betaproteobacteria bacterium]|jgi:membrane protein required for colicin V production|nr:colicin production protein [Betaproteobacteria bacterium]MEA3153375.1 rane protein required for colicin production [Betaproteobacteria bacterium]
MTLFDYVVLTIIAASVIVSLMRGFAREVLALAGWVIAFVAANALSATVAAWFAPIISDASLRVLTAFVAVFILTLIAASLLAMGVSRLLKGAGLGLEDRLLGGFFGLARGVLIVMLIVLLAGLTALPRQPAWSDAMLSPPLEALAGAIKPWLTQAVSRYISYD